MVVAEDIRKTIQRLAETNGPDKTFCASDVAMAMDKKNWYALVDQVMLVARIMIEEGKVIAHPAGEKQDTFKAKGPSI